METKQRSKMLFVVGIIMIGFGAIGLIGGLIVLAGVSAASSYLSYTGISAGVYIGMVTFSVVGSALQLTAGIFGIIYSKKPAKAQFCIICGIVVIAVQVISLILTIYIYMSLSNGPMSAYSPNIVSGSTIAGSVLGFVLPVLYLIGALKLKKMAESQNIPNPFAQDSVQTGPQRQFVNNTPQGQVPNAQQGVPGQATQGNVQPRAPQAAPQQAPQTAPQAPQSQPTSDQGMQNAAPEHEAPKNPEDV